MTNAEQLRKYLKRIEVDGSIVINKDVCHKIIERCERWIMDKRQNNFRNINSLSFEAWAEQDEVLQELWELCQSYRAKLNEAKK